MLKKQLNLYKHFAVMRMNEIFVRYIEMPAVINAVTREDANGDYNIYVNINKSYETQQKALKHELKHIYGNDFYNDLPIAVIEGT